MIEILSVVRNGVHVIIHLHELVCGEILVLHVVTPDLETEGLWVAFLCFNDCLFLAL